jgi:signal peptidase I
VIRWLFVAVVTVAVVLGVVAGVLAVTSHLYRIPVASMEPTLHCARPAVGCLGGSNDRVVVPRFFAKTPERGDIVAFHATQLGRERCGVGGVYVARVLGIGGDAIGERKGILVRNGRPLREPYVKYRDRETTSVLHLRADSYYVRGDNRVAACDSRVFGSVPKSAVIGKVVATYWPPSRISIR